MEIKKDLAIIGLIILAVILGGWGWNNQAQNEALENSLETMETQLETQAEKNRQAVDSIQEVLTGHRLQFWKIKKDLETLEAEKAVILLNYEKENFMDLNLDADGWARVLSRSANNYRNRRQDPPPAN